MADQKKDTVEDLFKKASDLLNNQVRLPAVFGKLAERGHTPQNEQEMQELAALSQKVAEKVASGEFAPIPARELEQDGALSKHASTKAEQDFLAFAPEYKIEAEKLPEELKKAAAVMSLGMM